MTRHSQSLQRPLDPIKTKENACHSSRRPGSQPTRPRPLQIAYHRSTMHRICDTFEGAMKSATIPPLRVTPDLRNEAESVLKEGESLSSFVEDSLRRQIQHRKLQSEFIARGLAARESAKSSGEYASKEEVMDSLRGILDASNRNG